MIHYEGPVGAREIAKRSWRSLRDVFGVLPLLFLATLILGAAFGVAALGVAPVKTALTVPKFEDFSLTTLGAYLGAQITAVLFWSALAAPLAVAIHRFILLRQTHLALAEVRRFFAWLAALLLSAMAARDFCLLMASVAFVRTLSEVLVTIGAVIVAVQIALIFPAIAIGVPAASAEQRLDSGFRMAEGNFWLLLRTLLLTQLPLIILRIVLARIAAGPAPGALLPGQTPPPPRPITVLRLIASGTLGVTSVAAIALLAATLSWLYAAKRRDP
ncbi:MAG TPA: hypothetical protein VJQ06_09590 [Rhizomicrobium sp.]|nr:hypothetical protein [Rhizomicrobium sp.]